MKEYPKMFRQIDIAKLPKLMINMEAKIEENGSRPTPIMLYINKNFLDGGYKGKEGIRNLLIIK